MNEKKTKLIIVKARESDISLPKTCFAEAKQVMMQKQEDGNIIFNIIVDESYNVDDVVVSVDNVILDMGFVMVSPMLVQHAPNVDEIEV